MNLDTTTADTPDLEAAATAGGEAGTEPQGGEGDGNLSVADLASKLSRGRAAVRQSGTEAQPDDGGAQTERAPESDPETPEGEDEGADDESNAESKAMQAMRKRIDKLTARLKRYEAGGQDDETGKADEPKPKADQPQMRGGGVEEIDAEIATWEATVEFLEANPDGGDMTGPDGKVLATVRPEQVSGLLRQGNRKLAELTATRATRVERLREQAERRRSEVDAEVSASYPWMNDANSPEYGEALKVLGGLDAQTVRTFQALPDAKLLLADLVAGRMARAAKAAKPASATRPNPPRVIGSPGAVTRRAGPNDGIKRELAEAQAAFDKSGSSADLARVMKLRKSLGRA